MLITIRSDLASLAWELSQGLTSEVSTGIIHFVVKGPASFRWLFGQFPCGKWQFFDGKMRIN